VCEIRHYSKRLRRKGSAGITTRCIVVEEKAAGGLFNVYEVRPSKVRDDDSMGYHYHSVSREWFSDVEEAINMAEIALRPALKAGFHEVSAETSGGD
jgi:hypothetical protein